MNLVFARTACVNQRERLIFRRRSLWSNVVICNRDVLQFRNDDRFCMLWTASENQLLPLSFSLGFLLSIAE